MEGLKGRAIIVSAVILTIAGLSETISALPGQCVETPESPVDIVCVFSDKPEYYNVFQAGSDYLIGVSEIYGGGSVRNFDKVVSCSYLDGGNFDPHCYKCTYDERYVYEDGTHWSCERVV